MLYLRFMRRNQAQYAQMQQVYERYLKTDLSRQTFCQVEGITVAHFAYWYKVFAREASKADKKSQDETAVKAEVKQPKVSTPSSESNFTQISLPSANLPTSTPMLVLNLGEQGKVEFYAPVEASFIKALLT